MLRNRLDGGWVLHHKRGDVVDEDTGRRRAGGTDVTPVRAALQRNELLDKAHVISADGDRDDRILIIRDPAEVDQEDWFVNAVGEVWLAVADGMKRHKPGGQFVYTAVTVRRAKEREHG